MSSITRRQFVQKTALAAAAAQLASSLRAQAQVSGPASVSAAPRQPAKPGVAELRWLDGVAPKHQPGATWGVPWARGSQPAGATFALRTSAGESVPVQSWPLATWPDGSLKWTAHAVPANAGRAGETLELEAGAAVAPAVALTAQESDEAIEIDTGVMRVRVAKRGR
ncbi:MAG TPA: twin-arginine translocation signal domain-containing protein, partial [Opitutus sp.]|nr:twin-arginine translocation signal domain-containing protein [Opitutus sp.]